MMDIITLVMSCSLFQDYSITHAMIQTASRNTTLMVTPKDGGAITFPTANQAVDYIEQQIEDDNVVNIGVTQIPSDWLATYKVTPAEIIRPCKNVAIASQIIVEMWDKCGHIVSNPSDAQQVQACALSMFRTGDPQAGLAYANRVMNYAKAHPFAQIAAPALARWEKHARVPKPSAGGAGNSDNNAKINSKKPTTKKDNGDNLSTENSLTSN